MTTQHPTVEEVKQCLARAREEPQEQLDIRLLDRFQSSLNETNLPALTPDLLPELLSLLPILQQDPEPITDLILEFIRPLSFTDALSYASGEPALVEALRSPAIPVQTLAVEVLRKAVASPADAAAVAGMGDLLSELEYSYFMHPTDGSQQIADVFWGLLLAPAASPGTAGREAPGLGPVWKRLFEDKVLYSRLFSFTSHRKVGTDNWSMDKAQKSTAQARLLELVVKLAGVGFSTIARPHFPDIERAYGVDKGEGLLHYAALRMVDPGRDELMDVMLLTFFSKLIGVDASAGASQRASVAESPSQNSSLALDFLVRKDIHSRVLAQYLPKKASRIQDYLHQVQRRRAAYYVAAYASTHTDHFLHAITGPNSLLVDQILKHIGRTFDELGRGVLAPSSELHVISSLPRIVLLPRTADATRRVSHGSWRDSPVSRISAQGAHPEHLKTLAVLFHGPDEPSPRQAAEAAAARVLYLFYVAHNPDFFKQLVTAADIVALKPNALAAIDVLSALVTANWAPLPEAGDEAATAGPNGFGLLSEAQLRTELDLAAVLRSGVRPSQAGGGGAGGGLGFGLGPGLALPPSGVDALFAPPAAEAVVPYLCAPPPTHHSSHYLGSDAYEISVAKGKVLQELARRISDYPSEFDEVKRLIDKALSTHPWATGKRAGDSVATLGL